MKRLWILLVTLALAAPMTAWADDAERVDPAAAPEEDPHNYPTMTRYDYIQECMYRQERADHATLWACACSIDVIAEQMPHERYMQASTAEKASNISGEAGEVMREPHEGIRALRLELAEAKAEADKRCFVRPNKKKGIWPDF